MLPSIPRSHGSSGHIGAAASRGKERQLIQRITGIFGVQGVVQSKGTRKVSVAHLTRKRFRTD